MRASPALATETRRILSLAWPVILTSLNWTILHATDVIVVGMTSTAEAAALGASRTLTFIVLVMAIGAMSGILVLVSRADGAGDLRETGRVLHHGWLFAGAFGLIAGVLLFIFADPMLLALGVAPQVAPEAARVVQVMAIAYPFQLVMIATSFFLEGVSRPTRVTVVNLTTLPINGVLAWAFSGGHLGLPMLGAVGAAMATMIASVLGAIGMVTAAWTLPRARERGVRALGELFDADSLKGAAGLARFGTVPAIASGLELAGFSILIALSTHQGEVVAHAFQIVFSIHNLTFALALGMGSAAGVRAGNAVGEGLAGEAAWRTGIAAALSAGAIGVVAVFLFFTPAHVTALFPATAPVHLLAGQMLALWAPFILFDGVQVVFVYALRSLGDQVVTGVNSILAFFVVTGGLGLLLAHLDAGPMGLVHASGWGMVAAAALHGVRLWWVNRRFRRQSNSSLAPQRAGEVAAEG